MELFQDKSKGAVISECGKYRYQLWRIWDEVKPPVLFIMLNPSKADASQDDPTVKRCIGFAKSWGYGGFYVGNLFAYRSTKPEGLLQASDPVGEKNLINLLVMHRRCINSVAAWGHGKLVKRLLKTEKERAPLKIADHYIELSKDGTPKHPLFLKSDLQMKLWNTKQH